jgi:hypothetical protein
MLFVIEGRVKNRPVIEQYITNIMKHYRMHTRKRGKIVINFTTQMGGNFLGTCTGDRRDVEINIQRGQSFLNQMRTLSHEFIHAKQFLRGELDESGLVWKGENCSSMKYGTEPYEIEAFGGEDALFMKCFPFELI